MNEKWLSFRKSLIKLTNQLISNYGKEKCIKIIKQRKVSINHKIINQFKELKNY